MDNENLDLPSNEQFEDNNALIARFILISNLLQAPRLEVLFPEGVLDEIRNQADKNPDSVMTGDLLADAIRNLLAAFQDPDTLLNAQKHEQRMQKTLNEAIQEMEAMEADYEKVKKERVELWNQVNQQKLAILELHDRIRSLNQDAKSQHD